MPRTDGPTRARTGRDADDAASDPYRGEYEVELERWFRRRFGWLCVAFLVWGLVGAAASVVAFLSVDSGLAPDLDSPSGILARVLTALASASILGILLHFLRNVRPRIETREEAVRAATTMILALGAVNFAFELAILLAWPSAPVVPLLSLFFWHVMASLFLPWTPRESLRPMLPLLAAWLLWHLVAGFVGGAWGRTIVEALAAPLVLVPGILVAWWRLRRHRSRFRSEVSRRFFVSMRRELEQARRIHESLFPQPSDDGVFRFEYRYRPAHQIGGDFVHLWSDHSGVTHLAILDVTGHGLASAMTVHRIFGELERLRWEHPYLRPGNILSLLNRYVLLTLAPHKIFATGVLLRIDPRDGSLTYASAGHPPVLLRSRTGAVRDLGSTHPMLGALQPQDFGVDDRSLVLEPGDTLVAYTDGAFEARNRKGHKMGIGRLREAIRRQPPPSSWSDYLLQLVDGFSGGAREDDVLVAALTYLGKPAGTRVIAAPREASPREATPEPPVPA